MRKINSVNALIALLPLPWFFSFHLIDISRSLFVISLIWMVWNKVKNRQPNVFEADPLNPIMLAMILAFLILLPIVGIIRIYLGDHSVDQMIFAQIAENFARYHNFETSLNRPFVNNFLADHFSPALALCGMLVKMGVPSAWSTIIVQALSLALATFFLWRICRHFEFSTSLSFFFMLCFLFNADIRMQAYWDVQVEYMSLGLVFAAFERWLKGRHWQAVICAVLCFTFKETLILWAGAFALMALGERLLEKKKLERSYLFLLLVSVSSFLLFYFGHSLIFGRGFDYNNRIDLFFMFRSWDVFLAKAFYFAHFLIPVLFIPVWRKRTWIYLLPLVPAFLMAFVSNSLDMYLIDKQYVLFPMSLSILLGIIVYGKFWRHLRISQPVALLLMSTCFLYGSHKPMRHLANYNSQALLSNSGLSTLPPDATIIVTPKSALFLLEHRRLFSHIVVSGSEQKVEFDYVVVEKPFEGELPDYVLDSSKECLDNVQWTIRCHF